MRGAWIEMHRYERRQPVDGVAPPCGARGLKYVDLQKRTGEREVAPPCGARGLKCLVFDAPAPWSCRAPMRGAWIEIMADFIRGAKSAVAPPCGARGLKFEFIENVAHPRRRAPMRGAWIEMRINTLICLCGSVAPPCGARGLKSTASLSAVTARASRPHAGRVD